MNIEAKLMEKIKRFEDLKTQIGEISTKIGGLTEQQRALYNQGLEMKGQIDALLEMKKDEETKLAGSKTASLILPEGVKPVVADSAPVAETPNCADDKPKAEVVTLEVK